MARPRVRTGRIGGNQDKIDELEYFLEGIGRFLFGVEGEDFRKLAEYLPPSRNLSALLSLTRSDADPDVAEDLRYLYGELEVGAAVMAFDDTPDPRARAAVFRFDRYRQLLDRPERLIDVVEPARRLELTELLGRGASQFAPMLAKVNAYAWLSAVGIPDLHAELGQSTAPVLTLLDAAPTARRGLSRVLVSHRPPLGKTRSAYCGAAYDELYDDYRGQLARRVSSTQPLA